MPAQVGTRRWRITGVAVCVLAAAFVVASSNTSPERTESQPLTLLNGTTSGGYPLAGGGPSGLHVRFIDQGAFWVAVLVRNASSRPVTLLGALTPEPPTSLVHETKTGFSRYTPCKGDRLCPWPSKPVSTTALTLPPHAEAAVKFTYRLVSCTQATAATPASGSSLTLSYRYGAGSVMAETAHLGSARLLLERPAGVECLPRPYSYIGLVGTFTTSPGHKPIPGSDGDVCTKTRAGGLVYQSREFMDRNQVAFRIEIDLPRYRGLGSYHRHGQSLGPAEATAVGEFGSPGPSIFHDFNATVTVTTAKGTTLGGRFTAVFSGHRNFFRAYGGWRCTTRLR